MLQDDDTPRPDEPDIDFLLNYYEQKLEKAYAVDGDWDRFNPEEWSLGQARLRTLKKENPLVIEKIEASDARCDARYPQGCWFMRAHDGYQMKADVHDTEGACSLLDIAVKHTLSHLDTAIKSVALDVGLWANHQGENHWSAESGEWMAPASSFCVHAVNQPDDANNHLEVEFTSRLKQGELVQVNLLMDIDRQNEMHRTGVRLGRPGEEQQQTPDFESGSWRLHFSLNETAATRDGKAPSLLLSEIESASGQALQAGNLPVFVPVDWKHDTLMNHAVSINHALNRLHDVRLGMGKDDDDDLSTFDVEGFFRRAISAEWDDDDKDFSPKPAWNCASLINEALKDKQMSALMERNIGSARWAAALAQVCFMRHGPEKEQCIETVTGHIMNKLKAPSDIWRQGRGAEKEGILLMGTFLREGADEMPHKRSDVFMNTLCMPSAAMDALFEQCLGTVFYGRIPDCLKDDMACRFHEYWEAPKDSEKYLLTRLFDVPNTEDGIRFIRKRLLEKLPAKGWQSLQELMQEYSPLYGKLFGEVYPEVNNALSAHLLDCNAKTVLRELAKAFNGTGINAAAGAGLPAEPGVVQSAAKAGGGAEAWAKPESETPAQTRNRARPRI